jgi:aspartyl-tRNA(Asn)/glutamyl-tRNA(Gln) amidotransferase subunit C
MKLTHDEVKRIAKLARLELREDEIEKFSRQLSDILSHAKMLEEVNTTNVEPISQITGLTNVIFKDEPNTCAFTDELLKQTPQEVKDHMIKVKNVF